MEYNKRIDGFFICTKPYKVKDCKENLMDMVITYRSEGKVFAKSLKYHGVTSQKVRKIELKLRDYTSYNKKQESVYDSISLLTIINEVERVIYGY